MYPPGHLGLTFLLFVPLGAALVASGRGREVKLWLCVAAAATLAPDLDAFLPGLAHRGLTHSAAAAVTLGLVVAGAAWLHSRSAASGRRRHAVLGFVVGAGGVGSHLLGDVVTPMGVRPFYPVSPAVYSFDLFSASNGMANLAVLTFGVLACLTLVVPSPVDRDGSTPNQSSEPETGPVRAD